MTKEVKLSFNINDYGRSAEGNFRKYDVANIRQVLESAAVKERIRLREATGFLGHGRRQISGKLDLGEVEMIQTPSGALVLENIPACVTTDIKIDDDGTVTHTQEVLETDPGKAVQALMESKVGGFSWAAGGKDGQRNAPTKLNSFYGFDYVMTPGYAKNRSYQILESASQVQDEKQHIFEAMRSCGLSEEKAKVYADTFTSPYLLASELQAREQELMENSKILESRLAEAEQREIEKEKVTLRRLDQIQAWAEKSKIHVPDQVLESIRAGDFEAEAAFFERMATGRRKLDSLPGGNFKPVKVQAKNAFYSDAPPMYGTVEAGYEMD